MQRARYSYVFILLLLAAFAFESQLGAAVWHYPKTVGPNYKISLLTVEPGQMPYQIFGHSLLRIEDPDQNLDICVNFGVYDPTEKNFFYRVLMGTAHYRMLTTDSNEQLSFYANYLNKWIFSQELDISQEGVNRILARLASYKPDYSYRYDFFFNNCATRLRELIELGIGRTLLPEGTMSGLTFRQLVDTHTYPRYTLYDGFYDLGLGIMGEREATMQEAEYLPAVLALAAGQSGLVKRAFVYSRPLPEEDRFYTEPPIPAYLLDGAFWGIIFLVLACFVALRLAFGEGKRRFSRTFLGLCLAIFGCVGLLGLFLMMYSKHPQARANYNLLWIWPTHLVAAFGLIGYYRRRARVLRIYLLAWSIWATVMMLVGEYIVVQRAPVEALFWVFGLVFMIGGLLWGHSRSRA